MRTFMTFMSDDNICQLPTEVYKTIVFVYHHFTQNTASQAKQGHKCSSTFVFDTL